MWASKVRWASILTPRLVTIEERVMSWPERVMVVMVDDRTWCGVPTIMASVLELLSFRKFCFIHACISSRQAVSVGEGRAAEEVKAGLQRR